MTSVAHTLSMALSRVFAALLVLTSAVASAQQRDPAPNKAFPASLETFQLPSHGALLNALVYVAAGAGPHPTIVLLHGFPGNEKNLDLAQTLRRNGYDVLFFNYRGSWGSPGAFSFTHAFEDAQAAVDYMRDAGNAKLLRADPKEIFLVGHSMGGMIAASIAARDHDLAGAVLISAAGMADFALHRHDAPAEVQRELDQRVLAGLSTALGAEGMAPLAGCTPDALAAELVAHPEWSLPAQAPGLVHTPVLIVTSDDGNGPTDDALAAAIQKLHGEQVRTVHIATDHSYSGARLQLAQTVLDFVTEH